MLKVALALTSGIIIGIAGTFVSTVLLMVVVEDSPEILKAINDNLNNKK